MRMDLILGRRVLKNGLVLATTLITCTALQADDHIQSDSSSQNAGGPQSSERATGASINTDVRAGAANKEQGNQQEKFVQKALKGGQMEVRLGQLAQQRGQNEQVKSLGQALVRDHTQANQQLQQIAQSLNIPATGQPQAAHGEEAEKHAKHQQAMEKLQSQSGAEFDKEFVRMAIKHHKKDIQEFEQAQQQVQDAQLKSFVQQTLPKLRQHLQMAQTAARAVGVDEATISQDADASTGVGAPAAGQTGADRPRSSLDHDDGSSISSETRVGDREFNANVDADIDRNDNSARVDVDTDTDADGKVFQKGDGKVLGLPTSKTDGKYLGIIPKPGANRDDDADVSIEADADRDSAVGGAARNESGTDTEVKVEVDTDRDR